MTLTPCNEPKATKAAEKAVKTGDTKLNQAEKSCQDGNETKELAQAASSTKSADKLKAKLDKLEAKGKIGLGCSKGYKDLVDELKVDVKTPGGHGTPVTTTTLPSTGRAVKLDFATGTFAAGSFVCLSRIQGGCVNPAVIPNCSCTHLHQSITIDKAGPFADPQTSMSNHCGHGCVSTIAGCGPDSLPTCP